MTHKRIELSNRAFWDIKFEDLDINKHKDFIIRRVFERGKWEDIKATIKYYSIQSVKDTLINVESMSEKGLEMASIILNIPKSKFKCFTNKPFLPSYLKH
jgi:hypothetical protein